MNSSLAVSTKCVRHSRWQNKAVVDSIDSPCAFAASQTLSHCWTQISGYRDIICRTSTQTRQLSCWLGPFAIQSWRAIFSVYRCDCGSSSLAAIVSRCFQPALRRDASNAAFARATDICSLNFLTIGRNPSDPFLTIISFTCTLCRSLSLFLSCLFMVVYTFGYSVNTSSSASTLPTWFFLRRAMQPLLHTLTPLERWFVPRDPFRLSCIIARSRITLVSTSHLYLQGDYEKLHHF